MKTETIGKFAVSFVFLVIVVVQSFLAATGELERAKGVMLLGILCLVYKIAMTTDDK